MAEILIAGVLKNAIVVAGDHLKIARDELFKAKIVLDMLKANDSHLLVAIFGFLALLVTITAIVGFLMRKSHLNVTGGGFIKYLRKMGSCFRSVCAKLGEYCSMKRNVPQQRMNLIKPQEINREYVKNEIQASIENFRSMQEQLKLMESKKINSRDVKDIKAAIKTVRCIEEHLKVLKSQGMNEKEVNEIEVAIQPAIKVADSMEKIINQGVWLLGTS